MVPAVISIMSGRMKAKVKAKDKAKAKNILRYRR